ncbi:MAG TPA: hypothetical protein VM074_09025 [Solimonas sp.]|nr:hypothetical protein [Solimonas sp.]
MRLRPTQVAALDVAAASGLVLHGGALCVIADDQLELHRYDLDGQPLDRLALFDDPPLPDKPKVRKRVKPDLEALACLPDGALLALGSGSRPTRLRAAWIAPSLECRRTIDLAPLYAALAAQIADLNIEGAVVHGDELLLAHRGNSAQGCSAIVRLDLATVMAGIGQGAVSAAALSGIVALDLGRVDGVALAPTDLALHDGAVWLSAAAENTANPFDDGACHGSALGRLGDGFRLERIDPIDGPWKIEGLTRGGDGWLMVADADDPAAMAPLLRLAD